MPTAACFHPFEDKKQFPVRLEQGRAGADRNDRIDPQMPQRAKRPAMYLHPMKKQNRAGYMGELVAVT